jgi:hypothetical protein
LDGVASNGGNPKNPDWNFNFLNTPQAKEQAVKFSYQVGAHKVSCSEHTLIWNKFLEFGRLTRTIRRVARDKYPICSQAFKYCGTSPGLFGLSPAKNHQDEVELRLVLKCWF